LEREAVAGVAPKAAVVAKSIALSIDGGHVRAARQYQGRSFEVLLAQVSNDERKQAVFASVPAEANSQTRQLRGVLHGLGATPETPVTILSDGSEGPRSLGEAASPAADRLPESAQGPYSDICPKGSGQCARLRSHASQPRAELMTP
jgi:hypothetical protein